jgi:hypothetical protein
MISVMAGTRSSGTTCRAHSLEEKSGTGCVLRRPSDLLFKVGSGLNRNAADGVRAHWSSAFAQSKATVRRSIASVRSE